MRRHLSISIGLLFLCGGVQLALAQGLTKLTRLCIDNRILSSEAMSDHGLNRETLRNRVYVTLKAKLPRLQLESGALRNRGPCVEEDSTLLIDVNLITSQTRGGIKTGYAGLVRIQVIRPVGACIAYGDEVILTGPMGDAEEHINRVLDKLLTDFAAEYYKAGNP